MVTFCCVLYCLSISMTNSSRISDSTLNSGRVAGSENQHGFMISYNFSGHSYSSGTVILFPSSTMNLYTSPGVIPVKDEKCHKMYYINYFWFGNTVEFDSLLYNFDELRLWDEKENFSHTPRECESPFLDFYRNRYRIICYLSLFSLNTMILNSNDTNR